MSAHQGKVSEFVILPHLNLQVLQAGDYCFKVRLIYAIPRYSTNKYINIKNGKNRPDRASVYIRQYTNRRANHNNT
jgi:hypothetical protein